MNNSDFRFPSQYEIDRIQRQAEVLRARAFRDALGAGFRALAALPHRALTVFATRKPA